MLIKTRKHRYCTDCHTTHNVGDMLEICPVCNKHAINNQLYDLRKHGVPTFSDEYDDLKEMKACRDCTTSLCKTAGQGLGYERDPWISRMQGLYDEY